MAVTVVGDNTGADYTGSEITYLGEDNATTNFGTNTRAYASHYSANNESCMMVSFSGLSNITSSDTVSDVELSMYQTTGTGGTHTIDLRRHLRDWVEDECTWTIWSTGNNWTTGGALSQGNDISSTVTDTMSLTTADNDSYVSTTSAQMITDVDDFVGTPSTNYGWHFRRTDGAEDSEYYEWLTNDDVSAQLRPYLTVTHAAGGGGATGKSNPLLGCFGGCLAGSIG